MLRVTFLALATLVCAAQEAPISGYFRDSQGALRALQGVDGAWTAPIVIPDGVLSAGYSGATLWYKTADRLHVRVDGAEWSAVDAPEGPALARFDAAGALAEVRFPAAGVAALWDPATGQLGELRTQTAEPDPEPEQIGPGLFLSRQEGALVAWRTGGEPFALALADPTGFQLYLRDTPAGETPVGDTIAMPATVPGDSADLRFRLRNPGTAAVTISRLSIEVSPFKIVNTFFPPHVIAAAGFADFSLRFSPTEGGYFAATLVINDLRIPVSGSSVAGSTVEVEDGAGWQTLIAGATTDLGSVERGTELKRRLRVTPAAATSLIGEGFTLTPTADPTVSGITFLSGVAATATAALTVETRGFTLRATATEFPLPRPLIPTPPANLEPATQQKVVVRLTEPARTKVLGSATLTFAPLSGQPDEPAIAFLPQLIRTVPLQFAEGTSELELTFQTGTTAGVITIQAAIGNSAAQVRFTLPERPLTLTAARANVTPEVILTGFDNRRSVSKVSFTWYLKSGQIAAPGRMDVDVSAQFRDYFAQNAGGSFQLRAKFPLSGTASELDGVEVELTSVQGTVQTGRLRFE